MKIELDIKQVLVIKNPQGPDTICVNVNLPDSCWPFKENEFSMTFKAAANQGRDYVRKHFGIDPEVIDVAYGRDKNIPYKE